MPFFLEPGYPRDEGWSETNRERLVRKWGGAHGWEEQKRRHGLKERGREVGIERFDLDRLASSTLNAHRVVQYVTRTRGVTAAESLYADLNKRHFEGGAKLNDSALLAEAAARVGVPRDEAERFLASGEGEDEISSATATLRRLGVHSIPTFVVDGQLVVNGAARAEEFVDLFDRIAASGRPPRGEFAFARVLGVSDEVLGEGLRLGDDAEPTM